jgi:hypothetical protein
MHSEKKYIERDNERKIKRRNKSKRKGEDR